MIPFVSAEAFAQGEASLGRKVHQHDNVWWVQARLGYCKPVHEFRPFVRGTVRPSRLRGLLGFSHQVPLDSEGTRFVTHNVLDGEDLSTFCLSKLPPGRRNKVRQGLRRCSITVLEDSPSVLEAMRSVSISQALRFRSKHPERTGYRSAESFERDADAWRSEMRLRLKHPGNTFFGAWVDGVLAAYIVVFSVDDTWIFGANKSHTDHQWARPSDALRYHIVELASSAEHCRRVVSGGATEAIGVQRLKGEYLFRLVDFPYFTWSVIPRTLLGRLRSAATRAKAPKRVVRFHG